MSYCLSDDNNYKVKQSQQRVVPPLGTKKTNNPMNAEITFFEKSVTYDKFVTDIAARLASFMKEDKDDPEYISQRRAERIYGQANVLRWRRSGAIKPIIRPGKIEYPTAQLKELSRLDEIFIRWQLSKKKK